jgi:hypothetical protein
LIYESANHDEGNDTSLTFHLVGLTEESEASERLFLKMFGEERHLISFQFDLRIIMKAMRSGITMRISLDLIKGIVGKTITI